MNSAATTSDFNISTSFCQILTRFCSLDSEDSQLSFELLHGRIDAILVEICLLFDMVQNTEHGSECGVRRLRSAN